jgi:hypothetical protein
LKSGDGKRREIGIVKKVRVVSMEIGAIVVLLKVGHEEL